jgi:hypothetical protein
MSLAKTYFHLSFTQKIQQLFSGKKKLSIKWAWTHALVFFWTKNFKTTLQKQLKLMYSFEIRLIKLNDILRLSNAL